MVGAFVHHAKRGEESVPGVGTAFEDIVAVGVRLLFELGAQRRDRIRRVVGCVAQQEETAFFGREKEYEPHHHGHRRRVDVDVGEIGEELAVAFAVGAAHGVDEQLDRCADLAAELVCDLGLCVRALFEQSLQCVPVRDREEAADTDERRERVEG